MAAQAQEQADTDLLSCIITELKEEAPQDPLEMALDLTFSAPPAQTSFVSTQPTSTPALVTTQSTSSHIFPEQEGDS